MRQARHARPRLRSSSAVAVSASTVGAGRPSRADAGGQPLHGLPDGGLGGALARARQAHVVRLVHHHEARRGPVQAGERPGVP